MDGSPESISAEVITSDQFDQLMKGDKNEKEVKPDPQQKADKQADITNTKPTPATPDATRDVPTPPPPLPRQDDPGQDQTDVPQPQTVTAVPPPRPPDPTPATPAPPTPPVPPERPPEPKPEPPKPEAEVMKPAPTPPPPQKPVPTPPTPPTPPKQPVQKQPDKADQQQLAKMMNVPQPQEPPAKAKSGAATDQKQYAYNANNINSVLSKDAPQSTGSTAHTVSPASSAGSPTANAPKMSITMLGQFEADLISQYKRCWTYYGATDTSFTPEIHVEFNPNGALIGMPTLMHQAGNSTDRSLADSAVRAVRMCNPLRIPDKYKPYYNDWKSYILRFHADEMAN